MERERVADLLLLFGDAPMMLTDRLANTVYLTEPMASMLGDRAEALVNRLVFSLLGFGVGQSVPAGLAGALEGSREPWRAIVAIPTGAGPSIRLVEASAVRRGERLLCGVVRISPEEARPQ